MAKKIMIQGTMSNSGKSFLAAALCRIFYQDGYQTAPFKSQNMALNSYITDDGLEIGRAQAMQAEAAGISPTAEMNPILLKPTSHMGSQVVIMGEVFGNMKAMDYYRRKPELVPVIKDAFSRLEEQYEVIVLEGAGSPAEINLRENDIVNMGMAEMADAPVLLVGDIDRGGVFASLYGTVKLLSPQEQKRIRGLIINKFRGDVEILRPGLDMIEEKVGIPVVGVIPMEQIDLDDEDSLSERLDAGNAGGFQTEEGEGQPVLALAVIHLPHISNFTDFNPFESMEGVSLRYVTSVSELKNPDMILLPGTKNTMEDLKWLRQSGLENAICKATAEGKIIFGICGGYQMLGKTLKDPHGVEAGGEMKGIGLLDTDTVFTEKKTRTRVTGRFKKVGGILQNLSDMEMEGYEIHMGSTTLGEQTAAFTEITSFAGEEKGAAKADGVCHGNVYGTYVHGIFEKEEVVKAIVTAIGEAKGLDMTQIAGVDFAKFKEIQYNILADALRKHMDISRIYEIMEEGTDDED